MKALQTDIVNMYFLIELLNRYTETVIDEAQRGSYVNLTNNAKKLQKGAHHFMLFLRSILPPEKSRELTKIVKETEYGIDTLNIFEFMLSLNDEQRLIFRNILIAIREGQDVKVSIQDAIGS